MFSFNIALLYLSGVTCKCYRIHFVKDNTLIMLTVPGLQSPLLATMEQQEQGESRQEVGMELGVLRSSVRSRTVSTVSQYISDGAPVEIFQVGSDYGALYEILHVIRVRGTGTWRRCRRCSPPSSGCSGSTCWTRNRTPSYITLPGMQIVSCSVPAFTGVHVQVQSPGLRPAGAGPTG